MFTTGTFNSVINTVARSREPGCADKAAALLAWMEDLFQKGHTELLPDNLAFGAIMNAYANERHPESSDKAAAILQKMTSLYQLGYESIKPNTFVYNSALNCFAKQGDAEKAVQFLNIMESDPSIQPDVISYSTCINAWANSNSPYAGEQADVLLDKMTYLYVAGNDALKPNAIAYTAAMKSWASTTGDDVSPIVVQGRVVELLQLMMLQYLAGDPSQKPTKVTLDTVEDIVKRCSDDQGTLEWLDAIRRRIEKGGRK
jgi:pentatricopeptide repeat protein